MPRLAPDDQVLFYDGHCGLCHRTVLFVLKREARGEPARGTELERPVVFAPLQGETFQALVPPEQRAGLPDSIVLRTRDARLLVRSDAMIHILRGLGGRWRLLAGLLASIPRPLRDTAYDFVARIRYRLFGRREEMCPIVPPNLRARFAP
jgi:predicted DCC family thiol-disulfide oxidoreductase YuxK